jgi:hypothetical protein
LDGRGRGTRPLRHPDDEPHRHRPGLRRPGPPLAHRADGGHRRRRGQRGARPARHRPRFRLFYNEDEHVFVVELHEEGVEHLVGVYRELDQRIVARARRFTRPDFDLAAEIEDSETEAAAAADARRAEQMGDASQRLHHALRTDLGRHEFGQTLKSRAFIPRAYRRPDAPDDPAG